VVLSDNRNNDSLSAIVIGDNGAIVLLPVENFEPGQQFQPVGHDYERNRRYDYQAVALSSDGMTAIVVGRRGVVQISTDSGKSWKLSESNIGDHFSAVEIVDYEDRDIAIIVGSDGNIVTSEDKGESWTLRDTRTASDLNAMAYGPDRKDVIVVGDDVAAFRMAPPYDKVATLPIGRAPTEAGRPPTEAKNSMSEFVYYTNLVTVRVGTVLVILLLAQYMVSLARYHHQLAAFYNARRDAIELADFRQDSLRPGNLDDLEQMMHALTPYGVDFARSPRDIVEMAAQMGKKMSPLRSKEKSRTPFTNPSAWWPTDRKS